LLLPAPSSTTLTHHNINLIRPSVRSFVYLGRCWSCSGLVADCMFSPHIHLCRHSKNLPAESDTGLYSDTGLDCIDLPAPTEKVREWERKLVIEKETVFCVHMELLTSPHSWFQCIRTDTHTHSPWLANGTMHHFGMGSLHTCSAALHSVFPWIPAGTGTHNHDDHPNKYTQRWRWFINWFVRGVQKVPSPNLDS